MKKIAFASMIVSLGLLGACGQGNNSSMENNTKKAEQSSMNMHEGMDDSKNMEMHHSSSGEVPEGLKKAENPTFAVGSKAIMETDHMKGMKGAEATIVGAFDTTAYAVSYIPTTGGAEVKNHKWVIQKEIKDDGDETLKPGTKITIEADHMKGMEGAKGTVDSSEKTTVYMVDYTPTTGGEKVKNHKWVTESELSPVK